MIGIVHNGYQIAADRYTYLACLPWPLLAGAAVARCSDAARRGAITRRLAGLLIALAAAAVLALAALTLLQIRLWRDSETFWGQALAVDPESAFAHFRLAGELEVLGKADEARVEYERALALLPNRLANAKAVFHAALGLFLERHGDAAGAEGHYRAALGFSEDNVVARSNLGVIYTRRGELPAALDSFLHVLRVKPGDPSACLNARHLAASLGAAPRELDRCPKVPGAG